MWRCTEAVGVFEGKVRVQGRGEERGMEVGWETVTDWFGEEVEEEEEEVEFEEEEVSDDIVGV